MEQSASTEPEEPVVELLKTLLGHHVVSQASDMHILSDNTVWFRQRKLLMRADKWDHLTGPTGMLIPPYSFAQVRSLLFGETVGLGSKVFRSKNYQIRVQPVDSINGKKLILRIQPLLPPTLSKTLAAFPKTQEFLTAAEGMVLVCGGMGAGKTTLAASICSHWASRRLRHIASIEYPVEYVNQGGGTRMTHIQATFPGDEKQTETLTLKQAIRVLRQANLDGLFIGEVRDTETRDECLDFAATKEPLVTTIHAGGFADAVLRFTRPVQGGVDQATLRLSLAQCLHSIVYVSLAYTEKGEPVPVILVLAGQLPAARSAIGDLNPKTLGQQLNAALQNSNDNDGGINVLRAIKAARAAGATEESVKAAIPSELHSEGMFGQH